MWNSFNLALGITNAPFLFGAPLGICAVVFLMIFFTTLPNKQVGEPS